MSKDANPFKKCLSKFATGITVVSGKQDDRYWGITVNSFNSVSLDPKLILFSIQKTSYHVNFFTVGQACTVSILNEKQQAVSNIFASHKELSYQNFFIEKKGINGIIKDCCAFFFCHVHKVHEGGDHNIILCSVQEFELLSDSKPLLYYNGQYF